jgi:anti-sigma B factor antagonist
MEGEAMSAETHARWGLESRTIGNETHIRFVGEEVAFDGADTELIEQQLTALVEEAGRSRVVIDFGNVIYITSSMLSLLLRLHKGLHAAGGGLVLSGVKPMVFEIFEITRLTQVFEFRPDPNRAASMATKP